MSEDIIESGHQTILPVHLSRFLDDSKDSGDYPEVLRELEQLIGGAAGVAREIEKAISNAPAGSQTHARLISTILEMYSTMFRQRGERDASQLSDDELIRDADSLLRSLSHAKEAKRDAGLPGIGTGFS